MAWSYIRLWKLLLDKGMKRIDLAAAAHLTPNTLASLGKNKEVSMETLNKICNQLDCRIEDILEHIPDWKIDRSRTAKCRDFRLRSIFLGTMFLKFSKFIDFSNDCSSYNHWQQKIPISSSFGFSNLLSILFCMLIRNFTSIFMLFDGDFITSKITKNRVFATKPRMWFWPLILKFRKNRNDYGVCTEKTVYFPIFILLIA